MKIPVSENKLNLLINNAVKLKHALELDHVGYYTQWYFDHLFYALATIRKEKHDFLKTIKTNEETKNENTK